MEAHQVLAKCPSILAVSLFSCNKHKKHNTYKRTTHLETIYAYGPHAEAATSCWDRYNYEFSDRRYANEFNLSAGLKCIIKICILMQGEEKVGQQSYANISIKYSKGPEHYEYSAK